MSKFLKLETEHRQTAKTDIIYIVYAGSFTSIKIYQISMFYFYPIFDRKCISSRNNVINVAWQNYESPNCRKLL